MRSEVKERLMDSKKAAARQISSVRASAVAGTLDADELRERVLLYVLAKFGLAADEAPSRSPRRALPRRLRRIVRTWPRRADPPLATECARST